MWCDVMESVGVININLLLQLWLPPHQHSVSCGFIFSCCIIFKDFFFNWRDIRLSSLWEDSAVETYVDQPPQQMSDSRLQHATSAAAAAAASPTSAASSWFTAHNTHSPSENTLWDLVFNKISLFSLMWMWRCTPNHETQIWRILLRSKNYILM